MRTVEFRRTLAVHGKLRDGFNEPKFPGSTHQIIMIVAVSMEKPGIMGLLGPTVNYEVASAMCPSTFESNQMVEAEVLRAQTRQPALAQTYKLFGGESCGRRTAKTRVVRVEGVGQAQTHRYPVALVKGVAQTRHGVHHGLSDEKRVVVVKSRLTHNGRSVQQTIPFHENDPTLALVACRESVWRQLKSRSRAG